MEHSSVPKFSQYSVFFGNVRKIDRPPIKLQSQDAEVGFKCFSEYSLICRFLSPGVAGAGGVIINPGGTTVYNFAWSLGICTNNRLKSQSFSSGGWVACLLSSPP